MPSSGLSLTTPEAVLQKKTRNFKLAAGSIVQRVDENLTYDYLHSSEDNLWSLLYLTGYLTKAQTTIDTNELPPGMMELKIPNAEIKEIFENNSGPLV